MKITLYVRYEKKLSGYWIMEEQGVLKGKKALLSLLFDSFNPYNECIWVESDENDSEFIVISMHFPGDEDEEFDPDAVLRMSRKNYEYILRQWDKIAEQQPKYFILSYDDNGWIDLETKDELSKQDLEKLKTAK